MAGMNVTGSFLKCCYFVFAIEDDKKLSCRQTLETYYSYEPWKALLYSFLQLWPDDRGEMTANLLFQVLDMDLHLGQVHIAIGQRRMRDGSWRKHDFNYGRTPPCTNSSVQHIDT